MSNIPKTKKQKTSADVRPMVGMTRIASTADGSHLSPASTILESLTVGQVFRAKKVISLNENQTVEEALQLLHSHAILAAPVLNSEEKVVAVVDVLDLTLAATEHMMLCAEVSASYLQKLNYKGNRFFDQRLSEVLELVQKRKPHALDVTLDASSSSLVYLVDIMSRGHHRVPLVSKSTDDGTYYFVSQMEAVAFFARSLSTLLGDTATKSIEELGLGRMKRALITVRTTRKAYFVLQTLVKEEISAVPIVDEDGRLVSTFSASDVKALTAASFEIALDLSALDFVRQYGAAWRRQLLTALPDPNAALRPVVCVASDTFESVVYKCVACHVHRCWLVDAQQRPIGVISLGDILKVILNN